MIKRNSTKSYREALEKTLGNKCVNCSSDICVEYHHIVPLSLGGQDKLSNMVALCSKCHKAAHNGRHLSHYRDNTNGGRKRKIDKDTAYKAFDLYFDGQIGNKKCKEMIGYNQNCQIHSSPYFQEYLKEKGIIKFKNTIDVGATVGSGGLYEGRSVGYVKYKDGSIKNISYKETGANNVKYKRRK